MSRAKTALWGFLGMLLALSLYTGVGWLTLRYQEFKVMRDVVAQIIQQNQKPQEPVK